MQSRPTVNCNLILIRYFCVVEGHSSEAIDGHGQFMTGLQPIDGYNGKFGYRRNTPCLRREPSTFGVPTDLPLH